MNADEEESDRTPNSPTRTQSGKIWAVKPKDREKYKVCLMNELHIDK
ncbi:hypothetical protein QUA00_16405 [Microcoleus sp. T2B6]|jgi:hypothetical protein